MGDEPPPSKGPNGTSLVHLHRIALPVLTSLLLHAGLVVGVPLPERPALPDPGEIEVGDEGDAETLVPVRVHVEPDVFSLADLDLPGSVGAASGDAVRVEPLRDEADPPPPPPKKRRKAVVKPPPAPAPEVAATEDAGLVDDAEAVADAEVPEPPPEAQEEEKKKKLARRAGPRRPRPPPSNKKPCETSDDIVAMDEADTWWVERDIVEYYATHMKELQKLGAVWTHKTDGKPDGFKVGLSRCSLLKQGGLKSGDLVHDINGRKIHNLFQAIAAYFALRDESVLQVRISRKGEPLVLSYHIEQRERPKKKGRKKAKDEAASDGE